MAENPYAAPITDPDSGDHSLQIGRGDSIFVVARSVFLAWEKLRLVYNGVLVLWVLWLGWQSSVLSLNGGPFWILAIQGAVLANLGFFAGPIVDTYVSWLGFRSKWLRIMLFALGTALACLLALIVVALPLIPQID